jgi:hypothetical protein
MNEYSAGVGSGTPDGSMAYTWKVCKPADNPGYFMGFLQGEKGS